ncbi:MAG: glycosyltransferase [Pseudomonadota bacterium]
MPDKPVLGMILKGYPRISETFISNEILLLEELGFSVHIFSMRRPREAFSHDSIRNIRARVDYLPEDLDLAKLLPPNLLLALTSPRRYARGLMTAWQRYKRSRSRNTIKHFLQAGRLVQCFLPGSGVGHLHAHFAHSPTSVALFAGVLSGRPFSFTAHAKDIYTQDPAQLREKIGRADFVVTCTGYNKAHLEEVARGLDTPIHRIYHGIDLGLFSRSRDNGPLAPPFHILTVARLTAKKGLPTVYRALRLLADRGLDFRHTLIGDGDDREQILGLIKDLGLEDRARWLGTQPHGVVLEEYRRADAFALGCEVASNGDRDGIPNVILESMAMGVPVAATRVSAIPELVEHGRTGLLVSPGNPGELADALAALLLDLPLRDRIIPAARQTVVERFDNKALIGRLAELYRAAGL